MFRGLVRDVEGSWIHGPKKRKKGSWPEAKFPFSIAMVPLKLFFVGYLRERISSGSGVPKAGIVSNPIRRLLRNRLRIVASCCLIVSFTGISCPS